MKKLILGLILIAGAFLVGKYFEEIKKWYKRIDFKPNNTLIIIVAVACLLAGVFIGKGVNVLKNISIGIPDFSAKSPIVKNSNLFILCGFETDADIKKWQTSGAKIKLSDEFVASGKHSGKFMYSGGVEASKIAIEKYFYKDTRLGNWNGYAYLLFDIYNTQPSSERLILKIGDDDDNKFQRDIIAPSKQKYTAKIYLSELKASLDIGKIRQFNLFRWEPKQDSIFYIDNLRLVNDSEGQSAAIVQGAAYAETPQGPPSSVSEKSADSASTIAPQEQKKLAYLLKPDIGKWRAGNIVKFGAYIVDPLKIGRVSYPATGGIPFAEGELKSADNIRITDIKGVAVHFQAKPTAYWPDGSIKWLLVDLQTNVNPGIPGEMFIEYGSEIKKDAEDSPLKIAQDDDTLTLLTGPLKVVMNRKKFDLLGKAYLDNELVSNSGDMYIMRNGKRFLASLDVDPEMEVENNGPERITIKRSGWFVAKDGSKFCKYTLRIEAFKGKPYLRLYHTVIYTGYPENKFYDRYEGLKLPKNETIQEIGILVPHEVKGRGEYAYGAKHDVIGQALVKDVNLTQLDSDPIKRLDGWVDINDEKIGMMAAVRYFWQQYPKAFAIDKDNSILDIKLWPKEAGELDLKTTENAFGPEAIARGSAFGLAKTHEIYLYFHKPKMDYALVDGVAGALTNPIHLLPDPRWVSATTVLGGLREYDPKRFYDAESSLSELFDWANRMPRIFSWYGMLNFGDTLSWYRKEAYDKSYDTWGWHPEGRWGWYNCEGVGTHSGALIQYLRTGKLKYLEFGENLARHIMDVDTCHYNTIKSDPRLKGVLDDEVSQVGSMHRHNGDHWGGRNELADHTNVYGILLYYHLTGYERALEVAKEAGSFYLKDPITYTRHPDIAPNRAMANILWGDMLLYEATRDEKYKQAAQNWAKIFVEGQNDDGYWQENYNPLDKRWSGEAHHGYMVTYALPALIQYHMDTKDEAVGNAIIRANDYLMAHAEYLPFYDALSYSFWLTGDEKYQAFLEGYLGKLIGWKNKEEDDLHRGMLFDKLIYHRPNGFLYSAPFAFDALAYRPKKVTPDTSSAKESVSNIPAVNIDPSITYSTGIASALYKIFPDSYNLITKSNTINIALAKNEYESAQVVLYDANKKLEDVKIEASELADRKTGQVIAKENIEVRIVEYVKTRKPDYQVERVGFWPDPLAENKPFNLEPKTIQPIWITVHAPKGTPAGNYTGKIFIKPSNARPQEVNINVRVFNFELPNKPSLKTAFDFYYGRMKKVYPKGYQEDDAHYDKRKAELVKKYYDAMLKFKISPILNLDYPSNSFDSTVQDYLDKGMSAFAIGKYGGSFDNNWPQDKEGLVEYYSAIASHLKAKGWINRAYIYTYDEPKYGDPRVAEVAGIIHKAGPELKNMVCLGEMQDPTRYRDWVKDIDIFCIRNVNFDYDSAKFYKEMGKELWIYVSGPKPPFPNLAIDFPAMAYRILPWISWRYNVTGLLYWCVNFWEEDPWKNPMNTKWKQNGNGFLFYPAEDGPVPSIRLYVLRDGIEDYEYFHLLAEKIKEGKGKEYEKLLEIDNSIVGSMADYTKNAALLNRRRQEIAEAIEALTNTTYAVDVRRPRRSLTVELYRNGTIETDDKTGIMTQRSDSYRDAAIIRSTDPLPKTYKISAIVGDINYDLSNIKGIVQDPEYKEGPQNENGCYLLAITDEAPVGHHTNDWWHQHRKVCVDVDNNIWGSGMPNPIFMVYFDKDNKLMSLGQDTDEWQTKWDKAVTYDPAKWYKVEIEKTDRKFVMKIYDENGKFLRGGMVDLKDIWHEDGQHPDYLVIGDPHENYYQGSMKIKSISMPVGSDEKT